MRPNAGPGMPRWARAALSEGSPNRCVPSAGKRTVGCAALPCDRAAAHLCAQLPFPTQTAPGRYNEAALRGLDYLLDEARKAGIKVSRFNPRCYGQPDACCSGGGGRAHAGWCLSAFCRLRLWLEVGC